MNEMLYSCNEDVKKKIILGINRFVCFSRREVLGDHCGYEIHGLIFFCNIIMTLSSVFASLTQFRMLFII